MWFLTLGMCRSGVCVWVFPSTSRWGVYQRKSCRTKKIRRENTFLVWNEVNSAKLGLKTSIQISDPYVLIKSCLLNERPMFSDSEMPTASVQQYTFLFNQFCWNLKIQFKYQMFFFLSWFFTNYRHLLTSILGLFPPLFSFFSSLSSFHWEMTDPAILSRSLFPPVD